MTRIDWTLLILSCTVAGCVVYLMLDPDPAIRRIQYLRFVSDTCQRTARSIGELGLLTELEYRRLIELERTI